MTTVVPSADRSNWAGNYSFTAPRLHAPTSIEQAQELVAGSSRVRALGTRHSFNAVADTEGDLVTMTAIEPTVEIDADDRTATVSAGTRYGAVAVELEAQGWALHNMGSLPHISVAGAISTGTHGSGNANGNLATAVAGLEIITASGELLHVARGDTDFEGAVVSLGALGIISRVTLDIQPSFQVAQDVYLDLPWAAVLEDFDAVSGAGYSVSMFADWTGDTIAQLWVKSRLSEGAGWTPPGSLFGARRSPLERTPIIEGSDDNTTPQGGVPGPWSQRLPHFRFDATPSKGDEIQSEFFVRRSDAADALSAVRALADVIAPALLITELRTIAADSLWLSGAYERDSLGIHFTWKMMPREVAAIVPQVQRALAPFAPRPHWGKEFDASQVDVAALYPRHTDFLALASRLDPTSKFGNDYLRRIVGLG